MCCITVSSASQLGVVSRMLEKLWQTSNGTLSLPYFITIGHFVQSSLQVEYHMASLISLWWLNLKIGHRMICTAVKIFII